MKRAFVFILLISLILAGCSSIADEIAQQEESIQLNSIPAIPTANTVPTGMVVLTESPLLLSRKQIRSIRILP